MEADDRRKEEDEDEHERMVIEIGHWFSAMESQGEHLHDLRRQQTPGTCDFILRNSQISSWAADGKDGPQVLWMTSPPGGGKSILCSYIIEDLQCKGGQSTLYYFCGDKDTESNSCELILQTLAGQLWSQNLNLTRLVYQRKLDLTKSVQDSQCMLKDMLLKAKPAYIILDGVDDEVSVQKDTLSRVIDIQQSVGHCCKVLISSRDEPSIRRTVVQVPHIAFEVKNSNGIRDYILSRMDDLKSNLTHIDEPSFWADIQDQLLAKADVMFLKSNLTHIDEPSFWADIQDQLLAKADGMFLWERLVFNELEKQRTEPDLRKSIDELPPLNEAYERIVSRIRNLNRTEKDRTYRILCWLCVAFEPITIDIVAEGTTLNSERREYNSRTRYLNVGSIRDLCAPLLFPANMRMIHWSVKKYLLDPQSGPFIDVAEAHFNAALACIVKLTSKNHAELGCEFQTYARQYWAEHAIAYFDLLIHVDEQSYQLYDEMEALTKLVNDLQLPNIKQTHGQLSEVMGSPGFKLVRKLDTSIDEGIRAYEEIEFRVLEKCKVDTETDAAGIKLTPEASEEVMRKARKRSRQ